MTRIRIALFLVSLGLLVPMGLLAWWALDGLALERSVRHQAVAERVFDEMERALSRFLAREEARPFEAYRFYVSGPGDRSPLSTHGALEDFVIGAFQRGPDGRIDTPMEPRDVAAARARGDWPPDAAIHAAIAQVRAAVAKGWAVDARAGARAQARRDAAAPKRALMPTPGTTRVLEGEAQQELAAPLLEQAQASEGRSSAYAVLKAFNRGAEDRAERKQKVATARLRTFASADALAPAESVASADADSKEAFEEEPAGGPSALPAAPIPSLRALGYVVSESSFADAAGRVNMKREAAALADESDAVQLALDPMVGRPAGDAQLLLYRTVLVGEQGYRQGLVLDRARLLRWLEQESLGASGLSRVARLRFDGGTPAGDFTFEHHFAEPFDALSARLELEALSGIGSPAAIYGLVALVLLIGTAGVFAIHRMVVVVVDFAERRNNFVGAVTHELKTPLTAIRMYGEMLRDGLVPSDAKRVEYYETITDESERLSRLIDNVLEFSRLENGQREMNWSVGAVGPVLEEAAQKLRAHLEREGFALEVAVEPGLPPVRFDRDALLQVIFNLADNAMKYAGSLAERKVVLEARRRDASVEVAVRDFGPGVSGRHLSRIFEPFYRGEDELTRSAKGTGIGLALVKDLAERMGAAVVGANAEGGGFRVCLAFPATDRSA